MPLLASQTRYVPFDERMARERNGGIEPYIDLVERGEGNQSLVRLQADDGAANAAPNDQSKRRGRRPQPPTE